MSLPSVTGISPKEGTPGTKLTVRGENLGMSANDIAEIFVGQYDVACTVQWHSSSKLNIITSLGEGEMKIIVVTKSGGRGGCSIDYIQNMSHNVGLQEEVSYWPTNEHRQHQAVIGRARIQRRANQQQQQGAVELEGDDGIEGGVNFVMADDELHRIHQDRGSTSMTEPDFNPTLFLIKFHYNTNYTDLVTTLDKYSRCMAQDKMLEPISIVQANLYSIFQCLDCLEALKKKMDDEKTSSRGLSGAFVESQLCKTLQQCKEVAHQMFEEVLRRRDYSDSARSALAVMQRFQFLFNLPHSIRENIRKGDYSLVINDYLRARALFGRSSIRLFQQVYQDVESVVTQFRDMLRRQLLSSPPPRAETAKGTIRLLKQLDVDYDPAWLCLEHQKEWVLRTIGRVVLLEPMTKPSLVTSPPATSAGAVEQRERMEAVRSLNAVLTDQVAEMWWLAGHWLEQDQQHQQPDTSVSSSGRHDMVQLAMEAVVSCYAGKMRELAASPVAGWTVFCVQSSRQAVETLPLTSLPGSSGRVLLALLEELRLRAARSVLTRARSEIAGLGFKEDWRTEISDGKGAITRLPAMFQSVMSAALTEVARVLHSRHPMERHLLLVNNSGAGAESQATSSSNSGSSSDLATWVGAAISAYVTSTESVLGQLLRDQDAAGDEQQREEQVGRVGDNCSSNSVNVTRLLLLLANNVHHCSASVVPALLQTAESAGMAVSADWLQWQPQFQQVHDSIVAHYSRLRLRGLQLSTSSSSTSGCGACVSPFVTAVAALLAGTHSELALLCPSLLQDQRSRIMAGLCARALEPLLAELNEARVNPRQLAVDAAVLSALLPPAGRWSEALSLLNVVRHRCSGLLCPEETVRVRAVAAMETECLGMLVEALAAP